MPDIAKYDYVQNMPENAVFISYARAAKQVQEFFSEYLNKIEQAEQAAPETLAAQDDT